MDKRYSKFKTLVMGSGYQETLTDDVYDYNQALLDEDFEGLGNIYSILEEKVRGSDIYTPIRASIMDVRTIKSDKLVDGAKRLTFQNLKHDMWIGKRYKFADNIWIVTNVNKDVTIANSAQVQRCSNVLKWYDYDSDIIYEEPCIIGDKVTVAKTDQQMHIQVIDGSLVATLQNNDISSKISINQRFIINGSAYKVKDVKKIKRQSTYDKNSVGSIDIGLDKVEINIDTDDLENNIAYKESGEINPTLLNGDIITPNIDELFPFDPYNVQTYQVYNYIDDIPQADTFEFEFFDALSSKYKISDITANSFTVECLDFSNVPLVVSYRNVITGEMNEFEIKLSGVM